MEKLLIYTKPTLLLEFYRLWSDLSACFVLVDHNVLISLIIVLHSMASRELVANNAVWFQQSTLEPLFLFIHSHKGQLPENSVRFSLLLS